MLRNRLECMSELTKRYGKITISEEKNTLDYVPLRFKGYKSNGRMLEVFDEVGNKVEILNGFVPINGGTVLWNLD